MYACVYIAFEPPDVYAKDALLGRILNENLAMECFFPDKEAANWQQNASVLMRRAQAAVVLLSRQAENAPDQRWEIQELTACGLPALYVQVHADPQHQSRNAPSARCTTWDWNALRQFLVNGAK